MTEIEKENFLNKVVDYFSQESFGTKVIFLVGILAIFLGFLSIRSGIKNAFVVSSIKLEDRASVIKSLNRLKDTDKDGLSDYEETNLYGTSPYLVDTNADGISDYEEVSSNNSTCATGDCNSLSSEDLVDPVDLYSLSSDEIFSAENFTELKPYLIKIGYPENLIDSLKGESMYDAVAALEEFGVQSANIDLEQPQLEEFRDLDSEQIRSLLIQSGAQAEDLENVSDQELQEIYNQALNEM